MAGCQVFSPAAPRTQPLTQSAQVNHVTQTVLDFKIETQYHYQGIQERMVQAVDQSKEVIQAVFAKLEEVVDAIGIVKDELHAMKSTMQSQSHQLQKVTTVQEVTTEKVDNTTQPEEVTIVQEVTTKNPEETGAEHIIPWEDMCASDPRASRLLAVRKEMLEKSQASQTNSVTIRSNPEKTCKDMRFVRREYQGFYLYEMVEPLPGEHHLQVEFISSAITLTCKCRPLRLTRVPLSTLTVDQLVNIVDEHISFLLGNSVPIRCGVTTKICREGKDLSEFRTSSLRALGLQGRRIGFREQAPQADVQCYLQCTI